MAMQHPSIVFDDGTGSVTLALLGPRFNNWTPDIMPIGPSEEAIADGVTYRIALRNDYVAHFECDNLQPIDLDKWAQLKLWLMNGGTITVNTKDNRNRSYTCIMQPKTTPTITFPDREMIDYSFACDVKNTSSAFMICDYSPPQPGVLSPSDLSALMTIRHAWQPAASVASLTDLYDSVPLVATKRGAASVVPAASGTSPYAALVRQVGQFMKASGIALHGNASSGSDPLATGFVQCVIKINSKPASGSGDVWGVLSVSNNGSGANWGYGNTAAISLGIDENGYVKFRDPIVTSSAPAPWQTLMLLGSPVSWPFATWCSISYALGDYTLSGHDWIVINGVAYSASTHGTMLANFVWTTPTLAIGKALDVDLDSASVDIGPALVASPLLDQANAATTIVPFETANRTVYRALGYAIP